MGIFSRGKKYELLAVVRDNDHALGYSSDNFAYIRELVPRKGMDPKIYCMGFNGLGSYFLDNARTKLDMAIPKSASLLTVKANLHIISDKPFHSFGKPYGSLDAFSYDIFERDMARVRADEDGFPVSRDRNFAAIKAFVRNPDNCSYSVQCESDFFDNGTVKLRDALRQAMNGQIPGQSGFSVSHEFVSQSYTDYDMSL